MKNNLLKLNIRIKEIWQHVGFQKYFRNISWLFLGRFFSIGINFFVGIYLARSLGPASFGLFNYVISFGSIFTSFASIGIDGILTREIVRAKSSTEVDKLMNTGLVIKLVGGVATIFITVLAAYIIKSDQYVIWLLLLYLTSTFFQAFNVVDAFYKARVDAKKPVLIHFYVSLISTVVKIVIIWLGLGLAYLLAVFVLENILAAIFWVYFYRSDSGSWLFGLHYDKAISRFLVKNSWPLALASVAAAIYFRIDQVLIGRLLDSASVGIYAVAVKFSEVWYFIPSALGVTLFPAVINAKEAGNAQYVERLRKFYILMLVLAVAIATTISLISKFVILNFYGDDYAPAISTMRIYGWSVVGVFMNVAFNNYLMTENLTKISFWTNLLGMIVNITLNLYWIPRYGINGAAWATLISYFSTSFALLFVRQVRAHMLEVVGIKNENLFSK